MNVYGARINAGIPINQALADTIGSAIKAQWSATMAPHCPAGTQLVKVGVRDVRAPQLPEFLDSGALVSGTALGDSLPAGVAACVTMRTAGAGKSFRGRSYLGGFSEAENTATGLTSTVINTACLNFLGAIQSALSTNGLILSVMSRPAERVQIVTTTFHADGTTSVKTVNHPARVGRVSDVTSFQVRNSRWQSQRRRMDGRGTATGSLVAIATRTV
jgi:hypothetical protein